MMPIAVEMQNKNGQMDILDDVRQNIQRLQYS